MAEQLKKIFFTKESIAALAENITQVYREFDKQTFNGLIYDDKWETLELKEKMRHTSICLQKTLPEPYPEAVAILETAAPSVKGFEAMTLPDFVELYGMDEENWELSLKALGVFTKYSSSEFAIRPFLDKEPERVMAYMYKWSEDEDHMVRRLASEGCRPRLPWAMALPKFKKDPALILPVLDKLKNDPSETVRRSVANNLNDISKDNPEIMLDICESWLGKSKNTDWVIKHACRSMMKAGNKRALILFGFADPEHIKIQHFKIQESTVAMGEDIHFNFDVNNHEDEASKLRLEYAVYFMKANGKQSKKVFMITENTYKPGSHSFKKKHSFKNLSTRKHYPGEHKISIIVNGEEKSILTMQLNGG
jgi:3-methyladenine DNA glycosylase AlkC